jgi:hypothetical protein
MSFGGAPLGGMTFGGLMGGEVFSTLNWLPILPSRPPQRLKRSSDAQRVVIQNISPIPTPAPPVDLTWQPCLPAHPQRYRVRNFQPIARPDISFIPGPDLSWLFTAPEQTPSVRLKYRPRQPVIQIAQAPGLIPIKVLSWIPIFRGGPQQRRVQNRIPQSWLVPSPIIFDAANCVTWTEVALSGSLLTEEVRSRPLMTGETCVESVLTDEDLC